MSIPLFPQKWESILRREQKWGRGGGGGEIVALKGKEKKIADHNDSLCYLWLHFEKNPVQIEI